MREAFRLVLDKGQIMFGFFRFGSTRTHSFTDASGTEFIIKLPSHWEAQSDWTAPIFLREKGGDGGLLQITPAPPPMAEQLRMNMREAMQASADRERLTSVETVIELQAFEGPVGSGYYYSAQDRNPKPGEWEFLTRGMFATQGYVLNFTILSHRPPPEGTKQAMSALTWMQVIPRPQSKIHHVAAAKRPNDSREAGALQLMALQQMANLSRAKRALDAWEELKPLVERQDYEGVAKIAVATLTTNRGKLINFCDEVESDAVAETLLPFALNLAWALVLGHKARLIISPDDAVETVASAISYLKKQNEPERLAMAINNLGSLYMRCRRGDLVEHLKSALAAYDQAIDIYVELGGEHIVGAGHVLLHASDVFRTRHFQDPSTNVEMALEFVQRAVDLFETAGDRPGLARALSYRGRTYINRLIGTELHNWTQALEDFSAALDVWNRLYAENPYFEKDVVEDSANLGAALVEVGRLTNDDLRFESAVEVLEPACRLAWANNHHLIFSTSIELLIAYGYAGQTRQDYSDIFEKASALTDRLEAWFRKRGESYSQENVFPLSYTEEMRGLILLRQAESTHDINLLNRAAEAIERSTEGFKKIAFAHRSFGSRMHLADAFHRIGEVDTAEKLYMSAAADAREYAQKAVSLSSLAGMARSAYVACCRLGFSQARRGALYEALCTVESALAITLQRGASLARIQDAIDPVKKEELAALIQEHQMLSAGVEARSEEFRKDPESTIARIRELDAAIRDIEGKVELVELSVDKAALTRAIPEKGALVVPLASSSSGLWICIDNAGDDTLRLTTVVCSELSQIRKVVGQLPIWESVADALMSESKPVAASAASELIGALEWLGNAVCRPLCDHLSSLGVQRGASIGIVSHGLFTLVPFHAVTWTRDAQAEILGSIYNLTVVPSLTWLMRTTPEKAAEEEERGRVVVVADSRGDLLGSRLEGQTIVNKIGAKDSTLLSGSGATKAALIEKLPSTAYLHVAGHSDYDMETPFLSSVILADENLTVADLISQVRRSPSTVVLSSCSSGMSAGLQETSESWGFPYALHSWGVKTVISNLWDVPDMVMLLFFSEYYVADNLMRRPVAALRRGQAYLRSVTAEDARVRLQEICKNEPAGLAKFEEELNFIVARYGASAPFAHPAFWAATFCSGIPEV